jgi:hypothetical protein
MGSAATETRIEPRWPVVVTIAVILLLVSSLPGRIKVLPPWFPYLLALALILPMAALTVSAAKARWLRIESVVILLFITIVGFNVILALQHLLSRMLQPSGELTGLQLLSSSIGVWAANVLLFSLAYWRVDGGGPEARLNHASKKCDWLFPQAGTPEHVPPDWHPAFVDYLFLSFCTATAFSPTDALPLTSRAKLLMMGESLVSLVTVIAVASRAINILGS